MTIDNQKSLAAKKHWGPQLRAIHINNIDQFEPHTLSWGEVHERKKALYTLCQQSIDKVEGASSDEARSIEDAYEALMYAYQSCVGELDIRGKLGDKAPRNHGGDPRRPYGDDCDAINADSLSRSAQAADVTPILRPEQRMAEVCRGRRDQLEGLTVGNYLRAMITGGSTDIERRALSEGSDSAGGFSVPDVLSATLIDLMRAQTVAIQAGAGTVPLTSDKNHIAKLASDPVPVWRGENALVGESDPTFTRVTFEPKSLAVLVRVSRELLEDSLNIGTELPRVLAAAMAGELDRAIFLGTGSSNEPSGLDTIVGVQTVAHNDVVASYSPLLLARKKLMAANVEKVSAYVAHPNVEAEFGALVDTTGQPLNHPPILDRPDPMRFLTSTRLPIDLGTGTNEATIYCGDFSQLVIGLRSDVRIEVLKERYADTLQYGFLCHARYDVVAVQPQALCRITGVKI